MEQKKKVISQGNKVNQRDEQARAQGYWHRTNGKFYYKGYYVNNLGIGLFEYFVGNTRGIEFDYYAR
jgi:hypothetical protein